MRKRALFAFLGVLTILFSCIAGLFGGFVGTKLEQQSLSNSINQVTQDVKVTNEESAITDVAAKASDSVVSIVITEDVPTYENYNFNPYQNDPFNFFQQQQQNPTGTQQQEVGEGSGFIVSKDGLIITNRHVVESTTASYTVILNSGDKYTAKVLARDTLLDIAFIKIDASSLTPLDLGSSSSLKVGQTVVAIGNALGQFSNTVSSGIISGLKRNITAGDAAGGSTEQLSNVIQTDASINLGNSGGPLLDINGNVIGVNVAVASDAQNIGFAIPIDVVKDLLNRLNTEGNIQRPMLGVRYIQIDSTVQKQNNLSVDYGALVSRGSSSSQVAVLPGSPADKAGLKENDIILEINGTKVTSDNTLSTQIQQFKIGDKVTLKLLRAGKDVNVDVTLDQAQTSSN